MITTNGQLYQWDRGRVIEVFPVNGYRVDEIHIFNGTSEYALVLEKWDKDGKTYAKIPDKVLQVDNNVDIYAVMVEGDSRYTQQHINATVLHRVKPEDYVYTEEEQSAYDRLEKKLMDAIPKVDEVLDEKSTNAIQNKAVALEIKNLKENSGGNVEELISKAIADLVNSAPETLDTLNEIAEALNNDPDFSNTILTELGKKANSSDLSKVATSGSYIDLKDKPIIVSTSEDGTHNYNSFTTEGIYVLLEPYKERYKLLIVTKDNDHYDEETGEYGYAIVQYLFTTYDVTKRIYIKGKWTETTLATKDYVASAIAKLVDSSPDALDTLNELAKALGNDPNFATTILNMLSQKANSKDLSKVATSGSYIDLSDEPIILTNTTAIDELITPGLYLYKNEVGYSNYFVIVSTTSFYTPIDGYAWEKKIISQFIYRDGKLIKREKISLIPVENPSVGEPIYYDWEEVPLNDSLASKDDVAKEIGAVKKYVDSVVGNVESALDILLSIQESALGGAE